MNRRVFITVFSLTLVLILVLAGCKSTRSTPTEIQFTVSGNEIHRLNIYANKGQTIKGSWKSDNAVYRWWTSPGGVAYPLEDYGTEFGITGVHEPTNQDPQPGFWINGKEIEHSMAGTYGGDINIKCDHPYGESGYYTICFYSLFYETNENVNITVSYWLE